MSDKKAYIIVYGLYRKGPYENDYVLLQSKVSKAIEEAYVPYGNPFHAEDSMICQAMILREEEDD